MTKFIMLLIPLAVLNTYATSANNSINTIVEFFSFTCSHCADINARLNEYIATHHIKYLDINIDNHSNAIATSIMYYVAIDAGVGQQFKEMYFKAIAHGMTAYTRNTLDYVVKQVNNPTMQRLLKSKVEQQHIKDKLNYALNLLNIYHIQVTPTFLINQTTLLVGEDVIDSLISTDEAHNESNKDFSFGLTK